MKTTPLLVLLTFGAAILSGCIVDESEPGPDPTTSPTPSPTNETGGENQTPPSPATPPTARLEAANVSGTAPFTVTFDLASDEPDARFLDWSFDADGDGTPEKTGYGLPAEAEHTYEEPGNFTARLNVTDIDGLTGEATLAVEVAAEPEALLPAPIYFNGTVTGISDQDGGYVTGEDVALPFNLTTSVNNITITFTVGDQALDLDFTLLRPDGEEAESTAQPNEPTGTVFDKADPPLFEDDREDLDMHGTWTLVLHPYLSYEGDYSIHVVFG